MRRNDQITFLQFIGPIFVILGHSLNGFTNIYGKSIWGIFSKDWIYIFHMSLFFFIAGFLFVKSMGKYSYFELIKKKFQRLLIPYLVFNIIFLIPKIIFGNIVGDPVTLSLKSIVVMFLTPRLNVWGHTWFLFCLFLMFCLYPLWKSIFLSKLKMIRIVFTVILVISSFFPINTYFLTISDLMKNLIFFWLGMNVYKNKISVNNYLEANGIKMLVIALTLSIIYIFVLPVQSVKVITAIFIILVLYALPIFVNIENKWVKYISKESFYIYLLHWPIMLVVREVTKMMLIDSRIIIILMIFSGLMGPILLIYFYSNLKKMRIQFFKK
ncbi:hypothetical protein BZK37_17195 [Enterococcus casseliflavus]|nr:hypothetical protein BZK37_17195 [Enterococcus casseliflavus]